MYAYFPISWDFGQGGDGNGGPSVTDPGTIYICRDEDENEDWEPSNPQSLAFKTSLSEIIEGFIDGLQSGNSGKIEGQHIKSAAALRDTLRAAAQRIDEAIATCADLSP